MIRLRLTVGLALLALLTACSDGARGLVIDDQGAGPDTPERARARSERQLILALQAEGLASAPLRIHDLPEWIRPQRRSDAGWYYRTLTVDLPTPDARSEAVVRAALRPQVLGDIRIRTGPPPSDVPGADPATSGAGTIYVIEAGDTLAALSLAFYGSVQHWRRIRDANPELADGPLVAGRTLLIPPLPE